MQSVAERLREHGWQAADPGASVAILPVPHRYYRGLSEGGQHFVLTTQLVYLDGGSPGHHRSKRGATGIQVDALVGITAPAVECLLSAVHAEHRNAASDRSVGHLSGTGPLQVTSEADITQTVTQLTRGIETQAASAAGLATLDAWLDDLQAQPEARDFEIVIVPAALAAFGRTSEARAALASYTAETESPRYRAFARRLSEAIDSGATPRPPEPVREPERNITGFGELVLNALERDRLRREAVAAMAAAPEHEKRAVLEAALADRGLSESPLWIETRLANRAGGRGEWTDLRGVITDLVRTVQQVADGRLPDVPAFLAPPGDAVDLSGRSTGRWLAVKLDPDAADFVATVHAAATRRLGPAVLLTPWIVLTPAPINADVAVNIGGQLVGALERSALSLGSFDLSTERAELVCLRGRLTRLTGDVPYLLEIGEPASPRKTAAA
jgi:hypothetical protein